MTNESIPKLVSDLSRAPKDHVLGLSEAMRREPNSWERVDADRLVGLLPTQWRPAARALIELSAMSGATAPPHTLALALEAAVESRSTERLEQQVEAAWSGPASIQSTLRRTDRAWIEVIESAREELWLASYSVGTIDRIQQALLEALDRGVEVSMLFETPRDSNGQLRDSKVGEFDRDLLRRAVVYRWPIEKRDRDHWGNVALMHAKLAIADRRLLLVTSANLSSAALERHIEVGILVEGGSQPGWLAERLEALVRARVIEPIVY